MILDFLSILLAAIIVMSIFLLIEKSRRLERTIKELRERHEKYLDSLTPETLVMREMGRLTAKAMYYGNEPKKGRKFIGLRSVLKER